MRTVRISDEVWEAIAQRGRFGETEDDVLRRQFNLAASARRPGRGSRRFATHAMTAQVADGRLSVGFESGARQAWELPVEKADKAGIREVRDAALAFASQNGATQGQRHAVMKALSDAGYYVAGRKPELSIPQYVAEQLSKGVPIEQIRENLKRVTRSHRNPQYVDRTYRKMENQHGLPQGSLGSFGAGTSDASADATLDRFRAFRAGKTLGGLDRPALIREGRR
jgi:hypothetical protein